ncbi:DNA repair protein XRCC1 isoform X1 [Rhagoletis pomonella]|uniref:DNA repair protein XRCC1 isoform X1 n=1 Tax=Rhagoletis pomonella TaxID=28610 RepID=UPI001782346F|nr:DNA repair protein XRCC1 isoform X1 [Rhagoletis pomonella]
MPFASFKSVREVSSEDCKYPAENLLKQTGRKWKTQSVGERVAYVVLELSEPRIFTGIDIGNEHSAFIEVLVSKSSCNSKDFTEILVTCSFMTPIESKNSTNANRVRCFNKDALVPSATSEKWQFIKLICTQPFNKHIQYGISFVKIHVTETDIGTSITQYREAPEKNIDTKPSTTLNTSQLGPFKLREESPKSDSESSTSLFQRWKASELGGSKQTVQKRKGPSKVSISSRHVDAQFESETLKKIQFEKNKCPNNKESIKKNKSPQCLDRNRQEIAFGTEENIDDEKILKKRQRLSENIELEREKLRSKDKPKIYKENHLVLNTEQADNNKNTLIEIKKIKDTKSQSVECVKNEIRKPQLFRSFNQLLKGTIVVISGIQNPERSSLRDKALAMGAKYRTDWGAGCTHLICAFKNTPKYNHVKGKGKIVTRNWVEDCYRQKKNIPWRRYALDSAELHQPESEGEILDESLRPVELTVGEDNYKENGLDTSYPCHSASSRMINISLLSSGSDTDDEIRRVVENNSSDKAKTKKTNSSHNPKRDVFDLSTEEEEFLAKKLKVGADLKDKRVFKRLVFFICEDITPAERKRVEHLIKVNEGLITLEETEAHYLISTRMASDSNALLDKKIVKPDWIYECSDMEIIIPINKYLC